MSKRSLHFLFNQVGGEIGLELILDDFYQRMEKDVLIGYFFADKNIKQIAQKQKEFLLFAMGVSQSYQGKTPTQAHQNLPPFFSGHFDRRLTLLRETLKDHQLNDQAIQIWIDFEESYRSRLVQKENQKSPERT